MPCPGVRLRQVAPLPIGGPINPYQKSEFIDKVECLSSFQPPFPFDSLASLPDEFISSFLACRPRPPDQRRYMVYPNYAYEADLAFFRERSSLCVRWKSPIFLYRAAPIKSRLRPGHKERIVMGWERSLE